PPLWVEPHFILRMLRCYSKRCRNLLRHAAIFECLRVHWAITRVRRHLRLIFGLRGLGQNFHREIFVRSSFHDTPTPEYQQTLVIGEADVLGFLHNRIESSIPDPDQIYFAVFYELGRLRPGIPPDLYMSFDLVQALKSSIHIEWIELVHWNSI